MGEHSSGPATSAQAPQEDPVAIVIDIETECGKDGCLGSCKHALVPHTSRLSLIGLYYERHGRPHRVIFRHARELAPYLASLDFPYIVGGHNFKFDLRKLVYDDDKNLVLVDKWGFDTQLEAAVCLDKIPDDYLKKYESERQKLNDDLPRGKTHRKAERHSLKTLAPYFLNVPPFWEDPTNHNNEEYCLKDCQYSYQLHDLFGPLLRGQDLTRFYNRLLGWTKMAFHAERQGVLLDVGLMDRLEREAEYDGAKYKAQLDLVWEDAYSAYHAKLVETELQASATRIDKAWLRLKNKTPEAGEKIKAREAKKLETILSKLPKEVNLDSPAQLSWLLRDFLNLDIKDFDDDESTGKEVLQKLNSTGREDVGLLLKYRAQKKLTTSFFPTYRDLACGGNTLHTSFNVTGTRTGRLSSSTPNLQQVPGDLHRLFVARPGYALITRDLAAIEPCIVAYYTGDKLLCDAIVNGGDFHSRNALIMFDLQCPEHEVKSLYPLERKLAKTCGLALMYGAGPRRIQAAAQQQGWVWSEEKCADIFENFKSAYHEVFLFKGELDYRLRCGEAVPNLLGRKHSYPNRRDIMMKGFNTLVQSSASDLLLFSTQRAHTAMAASGLDSYPLLWVHDETVFEAKVEHAEEAAKILEHHLTCHELPTPLGNIPLKCEGRIEQFWSK